MRTRAWRSEVAVPNTTDAIYKGLAISAIPDRLYGADFHNGRVDMVDGSFSPIHNPGQSTDLNLPAGSRRSGPARQTCALVRLTGGGEQMHARMTRYEGAAPDAIEEALESKKGVLPTEFGQTEGMTGIAFLVDRQSATIVVISLWRDEDAMRASEDEATRVREEVTRPGETASVERYEVALLNVEQAG